jgi:hypothetical protein
VTRSALAALSTEEAVALLVERAVWHSQQATVDLEVLFGPLLRERKIGCFGFQSGARVFWLPRALLARARRALRRLGPMRAWLDESGLHLRWREGAGGLNFHGLPAPPRRARVLRVVFDPSGARRSHTHDQRSAAFASSSVSPPAPQATAFAAPLMKETEMNVTEIPRLPPPLRVLPDMTASWHDADLDFDTAAARLVQAHRVNGSARDQPVVDLRTWRLREQEGLFSLQPLSNHQPGRPLRTTAFSALATRLGAPAELMSATA